MVSDLYIVGNWMGKKFTYNKNILWTDDTNNTDDNNNRYYDDFDDNDWMYGSDHETLFVEIYLRYPCPNNRVKHHWFSCIIYSNQLYRDNIEDGYTFPTYVHKYSDNNFTIMQYFSENI
jgi:hypothetical protein